jgi:hypothetical protein
MQHPTLHQLRKLVRSLDYVVSIHAAEELDDDNLTIFDFENIILTGQITERQRDQKTREVKCLVSGFTLAGSSANAVVKLGPTGKLFVITVYLGESFMR